MSPLDHLFIHISPADRYKAKREQWSWLQIYSRLDYEERYPFTLSLLSFYIGRYYPTPHDLKERLGYLEEPQCRHYVELICEDKRRELFGSILKREELDETLTLGEALRVNLELENPFLLSKKPCPNYSPASIGLVMTEIANTTQERVAAKRMILKGLEEDLAWQDIHISLEQLEGDLLLVEPATVLTQYIRYEFTCPLSHRKIYLNVPDCYVLTADACQRVTLLLVADLVLSYLFWCKLSLREIPVRYKSLVQTLSYKHCLILDRLKRVIDVLLFDLPELIKDEVASILVSKYPSTRHIYYQHNTKKGIALLLAECYDEERGEIKEGDLQERLRLCLRGGKL